MHHEIWLVSFFHLAGRNRHYSWPCSSFSFTWFLPWPQVVSSHTVTYQYSAEQSRRPHCRSEALSVNSNPFSDSLSYGLSAPSLTQKSARLYGSHNLFPISQESLPFVVSSPISWKPLFPAFCLFYIVSGRMIKPVLVTSCWLEAFSHQVYNRLILITIKISAKK